ncbi:MAG: hypothetical protein PUD51_04080 [Prevotellaceae bacterium]|nr:hypothetical protein [Prevotellaceae bacterium]
MKVLGNHRHPLAAIRHLLREMTDRTRYKVIELNTGITGWTDAGKETVR